jgi:hypothetical protein
MNNLVRTNNPKNSSAAEDGDVKNKSIIAVGRTDGWTHSRPARLLNCQAVEWSMQHSSRHPSRNSGEGMLIRNGTDLSMSI